jgi:hypothetical protein
MEGEKKAATYLYVSGNAYQRLYERRIMKPGKGEELL